MFEYAHRLFHKFGAYPIISAGVILIAWLNKSFISIYYHSLIGDKSLYTMMALNALEGHGFTETYFFIQQPEVPYYLNNLAITSPGSSMLLIPFLVFTGKNIILSNLLLDAISWLLFILAIRSVLKRCLLPIAIINIATLLLGFFLYPHETQSAIKDTISLALIFFSISYTLGQLNSAGSPVKSGVVSAILAFAPGFFKFLYLPLVLPLLLPLLIAGLLKKEKRIISAFWWSVLAGGVLYLILYLSLKVSFSDNSFPVSYQQWSVSAGSNEFIQNSFSENLKYWYPFIIGSVLNMEFFAIQFEQVANVAYYKIDRFFKFLNVVLFALLAIGASIFLLRIRKRDLNAQVLFVLTGILVSGIIISILIQMSILFKVIQYKGGATWTYVSEGRSYVFAMVFLQLLLFVCLFSRSFRINLFFRRILQFALVLLIAEALHGVYFSAKKAANFRVWQVAVKQNSQHAILDTLDKLQKENPGKKIHLITESPHLRWLGLLQGRTVYCNASALADTAVTVPEKTVLVTAVINEDLPRLIRYMQLPNVRILEKLGAYTLLIQE